MVWGLLVTSVARADNRPAEHPNHIFASPAGYGLSIGYLRYSGEHVFAGGQIVYVPPPFEDYDLLGGAVCVGLSTGRQDSGGFVMASAGLHHVFAFDELPRNTIGHSTTSVVFALSLGIYWRVSDAAVSRVGFGLGTARAVGSSCADRPLVPCTSHNEGFHLVPVLDLGYTF